MYLAEPVKMIYAEGDRIGFVFRLESGEFVAVLCQNISDRRETSIFVCDSEGSKIDYSKALASIKVVDVEMALNLIGHTKKLDNQGGS
jgi:hypothetical protein